MPISIELFEVCYIIVWYGEDTCRGMWIPAHLIGSLFQCLNELIKLSSCDIEIDGNRLGAFLPKFEPCGCWGVYDNLNALLPWVLEK